MPSRNWFEELPAIPPDSCHHSQSVEGSPVCQIPGSGRSIESWNLAFSEPLVWLQLLVLPKWALSLLSARVIVAWYCSGVVPLLSMDFHPPDVPHPGHKLRLLVVFRFSLDWFHSAFLNARPDLLSLLGHAVWIDSVPWSAGDRRAPDSLEQPKLRF